MNFIHKNGLLVLVLLIFSTDVIAGMNGLILPQANRNKSNSVKNIVEATASLTVAQMNISNIDSIIKGKSMNDLLNLWQQLIDARVEMPPNDRFFELKSMLEDHVIPVYQAGEQGIDVVALRAHYHTQKDDGNAPLSPAVVDMVDAALEAKGLQSNKAHADGNFQALSVVTNTTPTLSDSQTDSYLQLFNSYESQAAEIREKEAVVRHAILSNLEVKKSVDCNAAATNKSYSNKLKSDCAELIKLAQAHNTILSNEEKIKTIIDSMGGNTVVIGLAAIEFKTKFTPMVVRNQKLEASGTSSNVALHGSWDIPRRYYGVMQYVSCQCGSRKAVAQVLGKACPTGSTINASMNAGPYPFLNNVSTTCSPDSDEENMTLYSPSTLTMGIIAKHGQGIVDQVQQLKDNKTKLSGPEAMELLYELQEYNNVVADGKTHMQLVGLIEFIRPIANALVK